MLCGYNYDKVITDRLVGNCDLATRFVVLKCIFSSVGDYYTNGGSIFLSGYLEEVRIADSHFINCKAHSGGAAYINMASNSVIEGCCFQDCQAGDIASCVYELSSSSSTLKMSFDSVLSSLSPTLGHSMFYSGLPDFSLGNINATGVNSFSQNVFFASRNVNHRAEFITVVDCVFSSILFEINTCNNSVVQLSNFISCRGVNKAYAMIYNSNTPACTFRDLLFVRCNFPFLIFQNPEALVDCAFYDCQFDVTYAGYIPSVGDYTIRTLHQLNMYGCQAQFPLTGAFTFVKPDLFSSGAVSLLLPFLINCG